MTQDQAHREQVNSKQTRFITWPHTDEDDEVNLVEVACVDQSRGHDADHAAVRGYN